MQVREKSTLRWAEYISLPAAPVCIRQEDAVCSRTTVRKRPEVSSRKG